MLSARTQPVTGAIGVPVNVFPQIAFSEPVRNVPGRVNLRGPNGVDVPARLSAVGVDAQGQQIVI